MPDILIATHNSHKAVELKFFLKDSNIAIRTFSDIGYNEEVVEDGKTFEENALIKARVAASLGYIGIADDSGLCVDYLNGEPGYIPQDMRVNPVTTKRTMTSFSI